MRQSKAKRWRLATGNEQAERELVRHLGVYPVVAKLLVNRGIDTVTAGQDFLYGTVNDLLDPYDLKGMAEAVPLIQQAIEEQQRIVIYGDYDVDGITATSLMYRFLVRCGANVSYYIPERQSEGYGLNAELSSILLSKVLNLSSQ